MTLLKFTSALFSSYSITQIPVFESCNVQILGCITEALRTNWLVCMGCIWFQWRQSGLKSGVVVDPGLKTGDCGSW